jgi:hypothetical protein
VTLINPVNAATGVSNIGALTWSALTNASSYDVYLGTSSPGTYVGNVTTTQWTPSVALANNTLYYWKIVGRNAFGASSGTATIRTLTTWVDQTVDLSISSVNQNFDGTTPVPPLGWTTYKTDTATTAAGTWIRSTNQHHGGTAAACFDCYNYAAGTQGVYISPQLTLPAETCRVKFWVYRSTDYPTKNDQIEVYFSSNPNLTGATLLTTIPRINATAGWFEFTQALPVGAGSGKYVIFKGISQYGTYQYIDDVKIDKIPQPTNLVTTKVLTGVQLNWDVVPGATYRIYTSADPHAAPASWTQIVPDVSTNSYLDTSGSIRKFYKVTAIDPN